MFHLDKLTLILYQSLTPRETSSFSKHSSVDLSSLFNGCQIHLKQVLGDTEFNQWFFAFLCYDNDQNNKNDFKKKRFTNALN